MDDKRIKILKMPFVIVKIIIKEAPMEILIYVNI